MHPIPVSVFIPNRINITYMEFISPAYNNPRADKATYVLRHI